MRHAEASFPTRVENTQGQLGLSAPGGILPSAPEQEEPVSFCLAKGMLFREGTPALMRVCASINSLPFSHLGHSQSSGN